MSHGIAIRVATVEDAEELQAFLSDLTNERLPVLYYRDQAPTLDETGALIARVGRAPRSVPLCQYEGDSCPSLN